MLGLSVRMQTGYLRLQPLILIINELTPLIESIKFEFPSIAPCSLLQEVVLGPFVLHALVP